MESDPTGWFTLIVEPSWKGSADTWRIVAEVSTRSSRGRVVVAWEEVSGDGTFENGGLGILDSIGESGRGICEGELIVLGKIEGQMIVSWAN